MTTFVNVIDAGSTMPSSTAKARTVRPSVLPREESQLATGAVKKPRLDDLDASSLEQQWAAAARRELDKSRKTARRHPESLTAAARLAEAALLAGEKADAIRAAILVLSTGADRHHDRRAEAAGFQLAPVFLAAQILIRLGEETAAEDYLRRFDDVPMLSHLYAAILVGRCRYDDALTILQSLDAEHVPGVAGLTGYVRAMRGDHPEAAAALRLAQRVDPDDADAAINLAVTFWNLGSAKKAVQAARRAVGIAPGKTSVVVTLLTYLAETRQFDAARQEIRKLRDLGAVETADLLTIEAHIASGSGKTAYALTLLRRALELARTSGSPLESAALEGRVAALEFRTGRTDRMEALQKVRSALRRAPASPLLVALLADLLDKRSAATEVEHALARVDRSIDPSISRGIDCRLAFLKGHFDDACDQAIEWSRKEPLNERAIRLAAFWDGGLNERWDQAADRAVSLYRKIGPIPSLVNTAAYSLALARRGQEALPMLETVQETDLVLMATAGLVNMSLGKLREGFELYRQAANRADLDKRGPYLRALMTIHQAMGLRRLGVTRSQTALVKAASLPPVELPADWQDEPEFRFMAEVARRRGWPWPVMID